MPAIAISEGTTWAIAAVATGGVCLAMETARGHLGGARRWEPSCARLGAMARRDKRRGPGQRGVSFSGGNDATGRIGTAAERV